MLEWPTNSLIKRCIDLNLISRSIDFANIKKELLIFEFPNGRSLVSILRKFTLYEQNWWWKVWIVFLHVFLLGHTTKFLSPVMLIEYTTVYSRRKRYRTRFWFWNLYLIDVLQIQFLSSTLPASIYCKRYRISQFWRDLSELFSSKAARKGDFSGEGLKV